MIVFTLTTGNKLGLGLIALAFIVFALLSSMVIPRYKPGFPGRNMGAYGLATFCLFGLMLFGIFYFGKESHAGNEALGVPGTTTIPGPPQNQTGVTKATTTVAKPAGKASLADGKKIFTTAGCSGCHTLKDAGSTGTTGPNLDQLKPSEPVVAKQVTNGGTIMPPFKASLSPQQIQDVATYVSSVAGKA